MHRVLEYLERAEAVEALADKASDPSIKHQLLEVALQWRELARQAADLAQPSTAPSAS